MKNLPLSLLMSIALVSATMAGVPDEFTNLKVLPKDIGKRELVGVMQAFSGALGVNCASCHVLKVPGDFDSFDWADDQKEHKKIARGMMRMVQEINGTLLPNATHENDFSVRCVTCHHGVKTPQTLDLVVLEAIDKEGIGAGVARYNELREQYYGTGAYDFSAGSLARVAENLAQQHGDSEGARRIINLNLKDNPDDAGSYVMLAQLDIMAGDRDGAVVNVKKALSIEPENTYAARILQQLEQ